MKNWKSMHTKLPGSMGDLETNTKHDTANYIDNQESQMFQSGQIPKVTVKSPTSSINNSNVTVSQSKTRNTPQQQEIRKQNQQLRQTIHQSLSEISKLKDQNEDHEKQIETLLKFNERLLVIIETELNQYGSKKSERSLSLQPISEITERDSEYVDVQSIKASLMGMSNIKLSDIRNRERKQQNQQGDDNKKQFIMIPEMENLILGNNREELQSFQGSRAASNYSYNHVDNFQNKKNRTQSNADGQGYQKYLQTGYSQYQKQYSEYSPSQKLKSVLQLVSNYKKQYGKSAEEYEKMKAKIKEELNDNNEEIKKLEVSGKQFYDARINELDNIRNRINKQGVDQDIDRILNNSNGQKISKYSQKTLNKLRALINDTQNK